MHNNQFITLYKKIVFNTKINSIMSSNLVINALKVLFVNILCFFIFQNAIYSTSLNGLPKACPMRNGQGLRSGKLSLRPLAIDVQQCSGTSNISWVNPKNTSYADDLYTELNLSPGAASECLWLHNFDLNIPDGSTIYGLGLEIEGHTTSSGITPVLIQLTDKNGNALGENKAGSSIKGAWATGNPSNDKTWTYGGVNDMWSLPLNPSVVNASNFGFKIKLKNNSTSLTTLRLDKIRLIIYYTALPSTCMKACAFFYVDPVPGAIKYHWSFPREVIQISGSQNDYYTYLNFERLPNGVHDICVSTESNQGISSPCCMSVLVSDCSLGSIGNRIWLDENTNGLQDLNEPGLANMSVSLYDGFTKKLLTTTYTDKQGIYKFDSLLTGYYYLKFDNQLNYKISPAHQGNDITQDSDVDGSIATNTTEIFYLKPGQHKTDIDAGYYEYASVGDQVWEDLNQNGIFDINEPGVPQIKLYLINQANQIVDSTLSDAQGHYLFPKVIVGRYTIQAVIPNEYGVADYKVGSPANDNDFDATGRTQSFQLNILGFNADIDLGLYRVSAIEGLVWYDRNKNGERELSEHNMGFIPVFLLDASKRIKDSTLTDGTGHYVFNKLKSNIPFYVQFKIETQYAYTLKDQTTDDKDSDVDPQGLSDQVILPRGTTTNIDAGFYFDCTASAANLKFDSSSEPCDLGQGVTVHFSEIQTHFIPQNYAVNYLLVRTNDQVIVDVAAQNSFLVNGGISYEIIAFIYETNINGPNYFDINTIQKGITPFSKLEESLKQNFICYSVSKIPLTILINNCGSINGQVWYDYGFDGIHDPQDKPFANVLVCLLNAQSQFLDSARTDQNGMYQFTYLNLANSYRIQVKNPSGFLFTLKDASGFEFNDSDVDLGGYSDIVQIPGTRLLTIDAGLYIDCKITLGQLKSRPLEFECYNGGTQMIHADLIIPHNIPFQYQVKYLLAFGPTQKIIGISDTPDFSVSFAGVFSIYAFAYNPITTDFNYFDLNQIVLNQTTLVDLASLYLNKNICAGISPRGTNFIINECIHFNGYVWYDENRNGLQDVPEPPVRDLNVYLYNDQGTLLDSMMTNSNGQYAFTSRTPAFDYQLRFANTPNYEFTIQDVGQDEAIDSDVDLNGLSIIYSIPGGTNQRVDAGISLNCFAIAPSLYDINNQPIICYAQQSVHMAARIQSPMNIPSGFRLKYFLISEPDHIIISSSDTSLFETNTLGQYSIIAFVFSEDNTNSDYFDFNQYGRDGADFDYITEFISDKGRCGSISAVYPSFNINECSNVNGYVWEDQNKNGIREDFEPALNQYKVILLDMLQNRLDSTLTQANGSYEFNQVVYGNYLIRFEHLPTFDFTISNQGADELRDSDVDNLGDIVLNLFTQTVPSLDAGLIRDYGQLGDFVWVDKNGDGIQDANETGINDITLHLIEESTGTIIRTLQSKMDANNNPGFYEFKYVPLGQYYVEVQLPDTLCVTKFNEGTDTTKDSDFSLINVSFRTQNIDVTLNLNLQDVDLGLFRKSTIGNYVWMDDNRDGIQDLNEPGINDVTVLVFRSNGTMFGEIKTRYNPDTGLDGFYEFNDLVPGDYYIKFEPNSGIIPTLPNIGNDDGLDSDITGANGLNTTDLFNIISGTFKLDLDGGFRSGGLIGNLVWNDANSNGYQDEHEKGIHDIKVYLVNDQGQYVDSTLTNIKGEYHLSASEGAYYLQFEVPDVLKITTNDPSLPLDMNSDIDNSHGYGTTEMMYLQNGDNMWYVDGGLVYKSILAIEDIHLDYTMQGKDIRLNWNCIGNFDGGTMEILRFENQWEIIGTQESYPQEKMTNYTFLDKNINLENIKDLAYKIRYTHQNAITESNMIQIAHHNKASLVLLNNPVQQTIQWNFIGAKFMKWELYNNLGVQIMHGESNAELDQINVEQLPADVYHLKWESINGNGIIHVIKK